MSDQEKREARKFEPPPWEKDAFEALARKKSEEQEALELAAGAHAAAGVPTGALAEAVAAELAALESTGTGADTNVAPEAEAPVAEAAKAAKPAAGAIDDKQVEAMLLNLSMEETSDPGPVKLVARVASVLTFIAGAGMVIAGLTAIPADAASRTPVVLMGSGALSVFGLCFAGMAVWVWIRSNSMKGSR